MTAGESEVRLDGKSVAEVLGELEARFPDLRTRLRDDAGELRRFVNLYVNGEDIRFLVRAPDLPQLGRRDVDHSGGSWRLASRPRASFRLI